MEDIIFHIQAIRPQTDLTNASDRHEPFMKAPGSQCVSFHFPPRVSHFRRGATGCLPDALQAVGSLLGVGGGWSAQVFGFPLRWGRVSAPPRF